MEIVPIESAGYEGRPVPASLIVRDGETDHLGIILPGYRHTVDMPDLHYAGLVLQAKGADVLRVESAYPKTDFLKRPPAEQSDWLAADARAACAAGLRRREYRRITLVGKSLGTLAMTRLLEDPAFARADCVWSTPILAEERLIGRIQERRPRSLFIIGTADHFYRPAVLADLVRATNGRSLVLEGVHHGLEIEGDVLGSLSALGKIVEALLAFIE